MSKRQQFKSESGYIYHEVQGGARPDLLKGPWSWGDSAAWNADPAIQVRPATDSEILEAPPIPQEGEHGAAPPSDLVADDSSLVEGSKTDFRTGAVHRAAAPDFDTRLAEVKRVMWEQLKDAEAKMLQHHAAAAVEATHGAMPTSEHIPAVRPMSPVPERGQNTSVPEQDAEAEGPPQRLVAPDGVSGEHGMWCCASGKQQDETVDELPMARDMSDGFFNDDQVEDIIDRINDVVGIWGISEAAEREFIKPPVVAMNKLIKAAMALFMHNPLMDLLSYLMDEAMEFGVKVQKCAQYIKDNFVQPLTDHLVDLLTGDFAAISWIKDKIRRVIQMMSTMVTDEVVTKSVQTIGDSDLVD